MGNAFKILVGKSESKDCLVFVIVDRRILLKLSQRNRG
jgi:hypothetical protein